MNQNTLTIILDLVNRYGVQVVLGMIEDFKKTSVTQDDWVNLLNQIKTPFETYQQMAQKASGQ